MFIECLSRWIALSVALSTVPADVLTHIFGFVDPPDLLSLAQVSKQLNK